MRDTLKTQKDAVMNFLAWVRETKHVVGIAEDASGDEALVEKFLTTQHAHGSRHVPCCDHCGSDDVVEDDFKNEKSFDADKHAAGPAYRCQKCNHFTGRDA